jgi:hypothetical protein
MDDYKIENQDWTKFAAYTFHCESGYVLKRELSRTLNAEFNRVSSKISHTSANNNQNQVLSTKKISYKLQSLSFNMALVIFLLPQGFLRYGLAKFAISETPCIMRENILNIEINSISLSSGIPAAAYQCHSQSGTCATLLHRVT